MLAAAVLIAACMFYPYMPGEYDGLAVPLSMMSQLLGIVGLLLVPFGALWLVYELRKRPTAAGTQPGRDKGFWFGLASLVAATLVVLVLALGASIHLGRTPGIVVIALWAVCAYRLAAGLRSMRGTELRAFHPAPVYLVVLPVVAAILRMTLVGPVSEFGMNRAIENSAEMIRDIEQYRDTHGAYPPSLLSLWPDYRPLVVGVRQYRYEPHREAYNLYFEVFSTQLDSHEIVMYNKRDEHVMTSHDRDLLLRTPAELVLRRGYYAMLDTSRPHWRRFLFD